MQKKREEAIHAVPSSVLLGLLPCCFTLHSVRHQSTLFSESQLSHGSGSPSSPTFFSVVWFYTNRSFPEFSVSFPFQGPGSFSESLLRLLGSFPSSFYCTACARLSLPPYFPACSLWNHPAEECLGTHSPLWVMKSQTSI